MIWTGGPDIGYKPRDTTADGYSQKLINVNADPEKSLAQVTL